MVMSKFTWVVDETWGQRCFFDRKCMVMTFEEGYDWINDEVLATFGVIDW